MAILMEGQAKIIEMGIHTENVPRKGVKQNQNLEDDAQNFEWVCRKEKESTQTLNEEHKHGGSRWKPRRLDLPPFNGFELDEWILKVETYFSFYQLSEKEKVEATVISFEGEAMMWYRWLKQRVPMRRWEDLKAMILEHFRPTEDGDLYEQWMSVEQTGSVVDYRREFVTRLTYLNLVEEG